MGANTFIDVASGANAQAAFNAVTDQARYENGHGGYSGTIAEKHDFVMIPRRPGLSAEQDADDLIEAGDPRIDDKWGPAGCFDLGKGRFMFFGWASS